MVIFIFGPGGRKPRKSRSKKRAEAGWIYCLTNPSFPGMVKIGYTAGTVEDRMAQLDGTATPEPFALAGKWRSQDVTRDENRVHKALSKFRIRTNREFFELPGKQAIKTISDVLDKPTHTKARRNQRNGLAQGFMGVLMIAGLIWIALG